MGLTAESKRETPPPSDRLVTAAELAEHPEWGRCELIAGRVVTLSPSKGRHGMIAGLIHSHLGAHVLPRDLGYVFAAETGILLSSDPDTVRAPDVAFIRKERMPADGLPDEFLRVAPDLVVEVVSPSDRFSATVEKIEAYLRAGVRTAWIVDPRTRTIHVYRKDRPAEVLRASDTLREEELLPGWTLPLEKVFDL